MPDSDLQDIYASWLADALVGKSVTKVALEAGVARQTIYRVLHKEPVSHRNLKKLSKGLGRDLPPLTVKAGPRSPQEPRSPHVPGSTSGERPMRAADRATAEVWERIQKEIAPYLMSGEPLDAEQAQRWLTDMLKARRG